MLTKPSLLFPIAAIALPLLSAAQAVPTIGPDGPATRRSPTFYLGVAAATGLLASPMGFQGRLLAPLPTIMCRCCRS